MTITEALSLIIAILACYFAWLAVPRETPSPTDKPVEIDTAPLQLTARHDDEEE